MSLAKAAVAAGERQVGEEARDALVEDGAVVAACLVTERASEPRFADAGRAFDDQVLRRVDPIASREFLEEARSRPRGAR